MQLNGRQPRIVHALRELFDKVQNSACLRQCSTSCPWWNYQCHRDCSTKYGVEQRWEAEDAQLLSHVMMDASGILGVMKVTHHAVVEASLSQHVAHGWDELRTLFDSRIGRVERLLTSSREMLQKLFDVNNTESINCKQSATVQEVKLKKIRNDRDTLLKEARSVMRFHELTRKVIVVATEFFNSGPFKGHVADNMRGAAASLIEDAKMFGTSLDESHPFQRFQKMVCSWRGTYTYQGLWETFDRKLEEYTMQYMKYQLVKKVKDEWAKARSEFTRDMSVIDDMRSKVQMEAMQDSIFQTLVGTQVSDWKLIDVHAYDLYRHLSRNSVTSFSMWWAVATSSNGSRAISRPRWKLG